MRKNVRFLTHAAIIAALYAVLTHLQNLILMGSASFISQCRLSEALCILAFFTPAAIPGLTIGCIIANISSVTAGLGVYDMVFGSLASLLAAIAMYLLRNVRIKNIPFLALLMPAIFNGIIIGFEIDFFFIGNLSFNFVDFLIQGGLVALGEFVVLMVLGIPACILLNKQGRRMRIVLD